MKKFLLSCIIALGIGVSAQTNIATYSFNKSTGGTYTPITGGTKIFPVGAATTYDNEVSAAITIPSFNFGGVAVTSVYVSANGFITFGAAPTASNYTPLATLGATTGAISAFGQDAGGSTVAGAVPEVSYLDSGTEFVVQYKDHANYFNRSTERLNFQIRLNYSTGAINIVYGACTNPGTVSSSGTTPQVGIRGNSVTYTTNVSPLMIGNIPTGTTCDWSKAVTGNANSSTMLFSGTTNVNVKIPAGLQYTWTPGTQLPVTTFAATTAVTTSGATLAWTAPTGATTYNVQYRTQGSCDWTNFSGNPVSAATASLTGLSQNTTYQVQVQALNGAAQSIYSFIPSLTGGNGYVAAGSFTTLANCVSTVTGLASSAVTPDTATISWTASTAPPANGYEYYYSTTSTAPTAVTTATGATAAGIVTTNLSALVPSTQYYYWVRANCNGTDKGAWSSSANFTTLSLCPTVTAPAANASGLSVTPTITWTAINGATGYRLKVGTASGGNDVVDVTLSAATTSYTFTTALNSSTSYYYSVTANTATTAAPVTACTIRTFTTVCGAVGIPYTQNFENVTVPALPACTSVQTVTGNPWVTVASPADSSGFSAGKVLQYKYSSTAAANAWFYTPGLTLTGGVSYVVKVRAGNNGYDEKLKIGYGTSAVNTAMTAIPGADYTIAAGSATSSIKTAVFTPSTSGTYYIGFNANSTADQYYLYVDDISIDVAPTTLPDCITATTDGSVRPTFTWGNATNALGYKLYLGSTSGNYELINGVDSSSPTTYSSNSPALNANTTYYLKIVPNNNVGDAEGCTETTFTTGANPYAPYCGPFVSSAPTQMAPITSFTLNGVTNTSDTSATALGSFSPNESFTGTPIEVRNNLTTIPFSVTGVAVSSTGGWGTSVFVDWNNDGDFSDAGESYFNTTAAILYTTTVTAGKVTLTGNLAIPTGTEVGQKRLRIKYNYTSSPINSPLASACADLTNGQVEDYTVNYTSSLAVSDVNKSGISVYPNPFTDVLKISDVKGVKSISVNDVSGREVKSLTPSAELNLSSLKTGLYIVNLKMEDGSVKSFKAIKK